MKDRLSTFACTASVGPGATNMLTGAALATINRLPVLLLPGDIFATRVSSPVLQELEDPTSYDVSVNDAFRPVSRFFDRVWRAEQLPQALLGAMRVLTDPVETGAVTIALPQDVQAEAHDWPGALFGKRVWHVPRPVPEPAALARAVDVIREAKRPLIVAGGGVIYSQATEALREFVEATGIPVGQSQAGKGARSRTITRCPWWRNRAASRTSGTTSSVARMPSITALCPRSRRSSASSTTYPTPETSWYAPLGRCQETCTSSGAHVTRRATTSSTAIPAWATKSLAVLASGWPARTAMSS
jgi:TPP-dependent trihydroxycyclohexane-1,2-dione (THcHDO) dehydratase